MTCQGRQELAAETSEGGSPDGRAAPFGDADSDIGDDLRPRNLSVRNVFRIFAGSKQSKHTNRSWKTENKNSLYSSSWT